MAGGSLSSSRRNTTASRRASLWLLAAVALGLAAQAFDRTTTVELFWDGAVLHVDAAGSGLAVPVDIDKVSAIEIRAADSIAPPGGGRIRLTDESGTLIDEKLPRRLALPPSKVPPIGDWQLDERFAGRGTAWRRDVQPAGPLELRLELTGRFLSDFVIAIEGRPGAAVAVRRGLINHDLFVRDGDGRDLAIASIDPTPLPDMGSVAATAARAAALASLVIAGFVLLAARGRVHPLPVASRQPRRLGLVLILALAAVGLSAWVATDVLASLPHTPDEVVYLLQAGWLREGRLWGEVSELTPLQPIPFTYVEEDRRLPHYPPGWPAMLAAGAAAGAEWLVAPLLGGLLVWLLYEAGREIDGPTAGLLAAFLGAASPLLRVLSATVLSHAAAAGLILASVVLLLRADRTGGRLAAVLAGVSLGAVAAMRPLSAVAAALPMTVAALLATAGTGNGRRRTFTFGWFAVGAGLGALPALAANRVITGSAVRLPYSLAEGPMIGLDNLAFGLRNLDVLLALDGSHLTGWGWGLLPGPWMVALAFSFAFVPFMLRRARATDVLLAAIALSILIAHLGTRGHGLHGFGPRYHLEAVAPIVLLTARGFLELARSGVAPGHGEKRLCTVAAIGLFLVLSLPAAAQLPGRLGLYRGYNGVDGGLLDELSRLGLDRAVIVLDPGRWQGWAEATPLLTSDPDAPILVVQTEPADPRVAAVAGSRPVYRWTGLQLLPARRPASGIMEP